MKFTIKYLVSVRDRTGKREEELDFPDGSMLKDVSEWLQTTYGLKLPDPGLMSTLNGKGWSQHPERMSTRLHEGDKICIFSLISGG
jgi:molybdopterin converting factor small subunit